MKRLDFNQLATFVMIAETGSISKAASNLCRTQAAVSIQLKKLEESVGKILLQRTYNQTIPTREGEALLIYARRILGLAEEAYATIKGDGLDGVVRFGVPDGYARAFLQRVISRFTHRFPKVRLQIRNATSPQLFKSLHEGELDLILVTRSARESGGQIVRTEPVVWVGARGYRLDLNTSVPLALYGQGCEYRKRIIDALSRQKRPWHVAFECQGVTGFDIAITNGLAISAMATSLVRSAEWSVLDGSEQLPSLGTMALELHRASTTTSEAVNCLADEMANSMGQDSILPANA
jgi:DNA-binding transcriptional LysR family regulator